MFTTRSTAGVPKDVSETRDGSAPPASPQDVEPGWARLRTTIGNGSNAGKNGSKYQVTPGQTDGQIADRGVWAGRLHEADGSPSPQTRDLKPETQNLKPDTLTPNPKPQTRNSDPEIRVRPSRIPGGASSVPCARNRLAREPGAGGEVQARSGRPGPMAPRSHVDARPSGV